MVDGAPIAYAIEPADDWVTCLRLTNRLLRGGHRVLYVTGHPESSSNRRAPGLGSFLIPLSPAVDPGLLETPNAATIVEIARGYGVELIPVTSGSAIAAPLSSVRVGLYGGGGSPFNQAGILAECGFPIRFINDAEIRAGALHEVDVLIVPGGGFRAMHGQLEPLGEVGCRAIAQFVRGGGMYVGSCAGSYDCVIAPEEFVQSCPVQRHLQLINVRVWNDASVDFGALQSPGIGVVRVKNECPDHPVMFGLPDEFEIAHYNGPIFDPVAPAIDGASEAIGLASFAGFTDRFTPSEAFAGPIDPHAPTLLKQAIAAGRFSAVAGYLGQGRVVAFGSHPEFGFDLPMVQWGLAARMLINALLWQAASPPAMSAVSDSTLAVSNTISFPIGSAFDEVRAAAISIQSRVEMLRGRTIDPPPAWLAPDYALSLFGLTPSTIWRQSLDAIQEMSGEIADQSDSLQTRIHDSMATGAEESMRATVLAVERWMLDERAAEWRQDGGYHGVVALLRTASRMCEAAGERWEVDLGPPAGAYGYLHENPFHMVAGSYLAAVGCVAGALQLMRAAGAELAMADDLTQDRLVGRRRGAGLEVARDLLAARA